ncbi:flippase [Methanosarcina mazei]|uniref:Uncharacterized protein n=1 Tax=Methanosarcina mazei SarPi TaxID=1434115 RepID=A0A0E3LSC7_METMZ|nr:flippase [Methanosarcina mazei]AKB61541.1 hypothetical protein MSMAP_1556 [Methanosarcina mazei SarPi]
MQQLDTVNNSIKTIAKGSYFVFLGVMINLFLGFIIRIILVRFTTQEEFGMYSIAITITGIFTTISTLGLGEGSTRYIAYFRGKDEKQNVQDTIFSSIIIGLVSSILLMGISFSSSGIIATRIFNSPEISLILKATSITIPFIVLIDIGVAIFRGFEKAKVSVYINNILKNVTYSFLLTTVVFLKLSFSEMVYAYVISIIITGIIAAVYFIKKPPLKMKWDKIRINYITRELLLNSIPLLGVSILLLIMSWTDTLMLGYFKTPEVVGSYNTAYPIAHLLSIVLSSISFLYVPIIAQLYSKNQIKELKLISGTYTKWCFMLTLPIFFVIFMFPDFTLNLFFGQRYTGVSETLQILAFGCLLDSYFGFNYYTLLCAGKSRLLVNCSMISAGLNILLNFILIPPYGTVGAAIASVSSFALIEIYMTIRLNRLFKVHPFTKSYIKITFISGILLYIFYAYKDSFVLSIWTVLIYMFLFLFIYAILLLFSRSLDQTDIRMIKTIEKRIGINHSELEGLASRE